MDTFFQAVVTGIGPGALDGLIAVGIVLIYRTTGVLNFANAAMGTVGTYIVYSASDGRSLWFAICVGLGGGALAGMLTYRVLSSIRTDDSALTSAVVTLAMAVLLAQVVRIGWGTSFVRPFPNPIGLGSFNIGSVPVAYLTGWSTLVALVAAVGLGLYLQFTRVGTMLRALADNADAARLCGAHTEFLIGAVWAGSGAMSTVAGFFAAQTLFDPTVLDVYFLGALVAAVLGGLRSLPLSFIGAIGLEISRNLFEAYAPVSLQPYTQTFLLLLLIAILVVAPRTWLAPASVRTV